MTLRRLFVPVALLALAVPALAYIEALSSFKGVYKESQDVASYVDAKLTAEAIAAAKK